MDKFFKKLIAVAVIVFIVLIVGINSCSIIDPNERGIDVKLGQMQNVVIQPGLHWKAPFITHTRKFKLEPKTYEVTFSVGNDGAITKDMQTVGATVAVRYVYDESRLKDIVTLYANGSVIESAMRDNVKASLKETTGKYSIYDLVAQQNEITAEVANTMLTRMANYPIAISQTTITNWDWSDDFDRQIKETANRTQQVKQAEQDLRIKETVAQTIVAEANAKLEAEKLNAEAKRISADAEVYEKQQLAKVADITYKTFAHEEQMKYYEKWDGHLVPNYIPLTAAGGVVNLK